MFGINSISSLKTQTQLSQTSAAIAKSLERLSTGKRVNSPQDDPAAFALEVNLTAQVRGLEQGIRNVNDAVGILSTADAAISNQVEILQRMREIAVQGADGSISASDRSSLNTELISLFDEFKRITSNTSFNGIQLLDGSFDATNIQLSGSFDDTVELELGDISASSVFQQNVGSGSYLTRVTYAAGNTPNQIAMADYNGDGINDIASADGGATDSVSILLGKSDGTFQLRKTLAAGTDPNSIISVDLNGDNVQDLVTVDGGTTTVSVYIGNGDGNFQARRTFTVGSGPNSVAAGDLNHDGIKDLAVVDATSGTVSLLRGNGDGTFMTRTTFTAGSTSRGISIADVNADGFNDLVYANSGTTTLNVHLGNGDMSFGAAASYTVQSAPYETAIADMNRDGVLDIVATNNTTGSVSMLIGNGDGTYKAAVNYTAGSGPRDIQIGDMNNDDILDVVVTNGGTTTVGIFLGNGDGSLKAMTTNTIGSTSSSLALSDVDQDGVLDIVTADGGSDTFSVIRQFANQQSAVNQVSVLSSTKATKLIDILDDALHQLLEEQSNISALHSRLDDTNALSSTLLDTFGESISNAVDVDIAETTAELAKDQILQQAQVAALSQANLQMQTVLYLLRNQ